MQIQRTGYQQNFGTASIAKTVGREPDGHRYLEALCDFDSNMFEPMPNPDCRIVQLELARDARVLLVDGEEKEAIHGLSQLLLKVSKEKPCSTEHRNIVELWNQLKTHIASAVPREKEIVVASVEDIVNISRLQKFEAILAPFLRRF